MTPIPDKAMPVVKWIRGNVERPAFMDMLCLGTQLIYAPLPYFKDEETRFGVLVSWVFEVGAQTAIDAIWNEGRG